MQHTAMVRAGNNAPEIPEEHNALEEEEKHYALMRRGHNALK